jgi:hypothetical protein
MPHHSEVDLKVAKEGKSGWGNMQGTGQVKRFVNFYARQA